nr:transcription factor bHLH3 [Tanacetum cinerariifolium]
MGDKFQLVEEVFGPSQSFNTSYSVWDSDAKSYEEHCHSRLFLAKLARVQTLVLVPVKRGVLEIGSLKSIPDDQTFVSTIKTLLNRYHPLKVLPKIFGQELSLGAKSAQKSGPISLNFSPKVEDDMEFVSESYEIQPSFGGNSSNYHEFIAFDDGGVKEFFHLISACSCVLEDGMAKNGRMKKGGNIGNLVELDAFRQVSESCSLYDITASVPKFIWDNCRRAVLHLTENIQQLIRKRFRFEPMWLRADDFSRVVENSWAHGLSMGLGTDPTSLLVACELHVIDSDDTEEHTMLRQDIKELLTHEEILWRQRSRIQWLKEDTLSMFSKTHGCKVVEIVIPELDEMRTTYVVSIGPEAAASLTSDLYDGVEFCKSEIKVQCSHNFRICELALPASKRPKQQDVPKRARLRESIRQK